MLSLAWDPADYPFKLGVASGDPELYDNASKASVLVWTRLAPDKPYIRPEDGESALNEFVATQGDSLKGEDHAPVTVKYGIDGSSNVLQETVIVKEDYGHSVHHELDELEPGQRYWYQFT